MARTRRRPRRDGRRSARRPAGPSRASSRSASRAWRTRRWLASSPAYAASWMSGWANRHGAVVRRDDQAASRQPSEGTVRSGPSSRSAEPVLVEADADDRGDAERLAGLVRIERVDAGAEDRPEGDRDAGREGSTRATRPSRSSSVPSSRNARTVSLTNSGLPPVRSWMLRAPSASSAARATSVARCAVSGAASPARSSRVDVGAHRSRPAASPGRVPARTTAATASRARRGARSCAALDGSSQCRSSMTTTRGPVVVEQPVEVAVGTSMSVAGDLGRVGRHVGRPRPPSRRTRRRGRWPRWRRRSGAPVGVEVVGEQEPARERAGVDPVLVGDGLGEERGCSDTARPRHRTRSPSRSRRTRAPGDGLERRRAGGTCRRRPRRPRRPSRRVPVGRHALQERRRGPPLGIAPDERARRRCGRRGDPARAGLATERMELDGVAWPRRTTEPRGSVDSRPRAARTRRAVEEDLAGSSQRLDAGGGRDRLAGQAQVAIGGRRRGRRHDLAGGEPDADLERLGARRRCPGAPERIARAARAARTASSSWACGQPKTAKTASPMNFSRVPPSRSMASAIVASAAVTRCADLFRVVLGEHPDVVDEVGEEGRDDPTVARLADRGAVGRRGRPTSSGPHASQDRRVGAVERRTRRSRTQ